MLRSLFPDRITVITAGLVLAGAGGVEALAAVAAPPLPVASLATLATILKIMPVYIIGVGVVHKIAWLIDAALIRTHSTVDVARPAINPNDIHPLFKTGVR